MLYTKRHARAITGIARKNGLSKAAALDFLGTLTRIEEHRGPKAVVDVLKQRYSALLKGDIHLFKTRSGLWVGVWRNFSRLALRSRRWFSAALRILKVFGLFTHRPPERADYAELAKKLSGKPKKDNWLNLDTTELASMAIRSKTYDRQYPLSPKRCPLRDGKMQAEVLTSPLEHIESLSEVPNFMVTYYADMKALVGTDLPPVDYYSDLIKQGQIDYAGKIILLTKDRGLKLRPIANCNRLLQLAISPLHRSLMDLMKFTPECFVFSQDDGAVWASRRLSEGYELTSLDLTSASDNIPLGPQLEVALSLFPHLETEISMFRDIARMTFRTPYDDVVIRYGIGHPMGLNASFGLFTCFLIQVFYSIGAQREFAIVGDDLVFASEFTPDVIAVLKQFGIPINYEKSLFNNYYFAEFVGRVIDRTGRLKVFKTAPFSKKDPLGLYRQYGFKGLSLGPKRLYKTSYEDVVKSIVLYQDSPELRASILMFASPYEYLRLESLVPPPVNAGGVSQTILVKLYLEWIDRTFGTEIPDCMTSCHAELAGLPFDTFNNFVSPKGWIQHYWLDMPGLCYDYLLKSKNITRVEAYTVAYNEPYVVFQYGELLKALRACRTEEDGYMLIIEYEDHLRDRGYKIKSVTDPVKAERSALAAAAYADDQDTVEPKNSTHAVEFLWRTIKKIVKRHF